MTSEIATPNDTKLSNDDIATILWAASGVNRPDGKRTAPATHGMQYNNIYVADYEGNYFYDAINNRLALRNKEMSKNKLSVQHHVAQSSHVIIITADLNRVPGLMSNREAKLKWANVTAGTIAQNIYLMCADLHSFGVNIFYSQIRKFPTLKKAE